MPRLMTIGAIAIICTIFSLRCMAITTIFSGEERNVYLKQVASELQMAIAQEDAKSIANIVTYPLTVNGGSPSISIHDQQEFLNLFADIFTASFKQSILQQSLDDILINWRGAGLANGALWLVDSCPDNSCQQVSVNITAINSAEFYQSAAAKQRQRELHSKQSTNLNAVLAEFSANRLMWSTQRYLIRVDELSDGSFRYAAWAAKSTMAAKPDLILNNGKKVFDGSGGNFHYEFDTGKYRYICDVTVLGTQNSPVGTLRVFKDKSLILNDIVISDLTLH